MDFDRLWFAAIHGMDKCLQILYRAAHKGLDVALEKPKGAIFEEDGIYCVVVTFYRRESCAQSFTRLSKIWLALYHWKIHTRLLSS